MDLCTLRPTQRNYNFRTDNPRMPHLSVIMAYRTQNVAEPLPDTYVGVKMLMWGCCFQDWLEAVSMHRSIDSTCSKCLWLMRPFCAWAVRSGLGSEITDPKTVTTASTPTVLHWAVNVLSFQRYVRWLQLHPLGTFQLDWWGCEINEASWLLVKLRTESWWICQRFSNLTALFILPWETF